MSTFAELQALPQSKKIILLEISLPVAGEGGIDVVLNYESGVWFTTMYPGVVLPTPGTDGVQGYYANQTVNTNLIVTSMKVGDLDYAALASLTELRLQEESFFFDPVTTKLYIHFNDWHQPYGELRLSRILIGVTTGFCNMDNEGSYYYNDVAYEPKIISIPAISKQKDPSNYGILRFQGGSVTLNNQDGYFDKFDQLNAFRQLATLKFGYEGLTYEQFRTVFVGYIENYSLDYDKFILNIQDRRKLLSRKVPIRTLAIGDYAYLNEDDVNKVKPIAYGKVRGAALICLNQENGAAANYEFLIMDTNEHDLLSVEKVVHGDTTLGGGDYSVNLTTGIMAIATAVVAGDFSIICDFTAALPNGLDMVKDLAYLYAGTAFIGSNYNTQEWNLARADARSVGRYIDKEIEIFKLVEEVSAATDINIFIQDDGKYSSRMYDADRIAKKRIYADEWIGDPSVSIDESKFLSSFTVKYDQHLDGGRWKQTVNTTYQAAVVAKYKSYQSDTKETILTVEADAIAKAETVMTLFKDITNVVKRKTKMQNIDLEIGDFIIGSPQTRVGRVEQLGYYEVMGVVKNFSANEIDMTMRYVKQYVEPAEPQYQQGYLMDHKLFGDKLYGQTEWL